ncbi:MAG: alkaline phosphatase D family protein, partial [Sandaracinus sp.]
LGDTIYEYADGEYGALRALDPPGLCLSLEDYRRRHARYRTDLDAQAALRQHPLLAVWDDHEFANNASRDGAPGHDPVTMGPWSDRVAAARRAFFEWMPVRDETRVHRALVLGDLARLILLDTRMDERDPAPLDVADWNREDRRIVSDAQERWLVDLLSESDVRYTLVGNQVLLAPFPAMNNVDAWDGYPAQRGRVLGAIEASPAPVVVLTGDTHSSYAFDLPGPGYDAATQRGAIGVEWGASAISSPTLASDPREAERVLLAGTPHLRFTEQEHRGFVLLDLRPARARAELWLIDDVTTPDAAPPRLVRAFETTAADRACREVDATPSRLDGAAPPPAP